MMFSTRAAIAGSCLLAVCGIAETNQSWAGKSEGQPRESSTTFGQQFEDADVMRNEVQRYGFHSSQQPEIFHPLAPRVVVLSGFLYVGHHWQDLTNVPIATLRPMRERRDTIVEFLKSLSSVELSFIGEHIRIVRVGRRAYQDCVTEKGCYPKGFVIVAEGLSEEEADDLCTLFHRNDWFCVAPDSADNQLHEGVALVPGRYLAVTARRAGDVAGGGEDLEAQSLIGNEILFEDTLTWIDGSHCDDWRATPIGTSLVNLDDRHLSDLTIGPVGGPTSAGDASINRPVEIFCEGRPLAQLLVIDDRVLVLPSASGLSYVILELPLEGAQIERLQMQLRSMKFFSGEINGVWDARTRAAVAAYAEYRGADYRFYRPAVTRNLLDGLQIPDSNVSERDSLGVDHPCIYARRHANNHVSDLHEYPDCP